MSKKMSSGDFLGTWREEWFVTHQLESCSIGFSRRWQCPLHVKIHPDLCHQTWIVFYSVFGLLNRLTPYGCLATGKDVGMIEAVRPAKTVMGIQKKQDVRAAMQLRNKEMHRWIKDKNRGDKWVSCVVVYAFIRLTNQHHCPVCCAFLVDQIAEKWLVQW